MKIDFTTSEASVTRIALSQAIEREFDFHKNHPDLVDLCSLDHLDCLISAYKKLL